MTMIDVLVTALRMVAVVGVLIGFGLSVLRLFGSTDAAVFRSRLALTVLMLAFIATHAQSIAYRVFDYQSDTFGVIVAAVSALAGVVVAWAYGPFRRST